MHRKLLSAGGIKLEKEPSTGGGRRWAGGQVGPRGGRTSPGPQQAPVNPACWVPSSPDPRAHGLAALRGTGEEGSRSVLPPPRPQEGRPGPGKCTCLFSVMSRSVLPGVGVPNDRPAGAPFKATCWPRGTLVTTAVCTAPPRPAQAALPPSPPRSRVGTHLSHGRMPPLNGDRSQGGWERMCPHPLVTSRRQLRGRGHHRGGSLGRLVPCRGLPREVQSMD